MKQQPVSWTLLKRLRKAGSNNVKNIPLGVLRFVFHPSRVFTCSITKYKSEGDTHAYARSRARTNVQERWSDGIGKRLEKQTERNMIINNRRFKKAAASSAIRSNAASWETVAAITKQQKKTSLCRLLLINLDQTVSADNGES